MCPGKGDKWLNCFDTDLEHAQHLWSSDYTEQYTDIEKEKKREGGGGGGGVDVASFRT